MAKSNLSKPVIICNVEDCNSVFFAKGYCQKHYWQQHRHGKIMDRTIYDPNEFIIDGGICMIQIYDINCEPKEVAIIDVADIPLACGIKWSLDGHGYVTRSTGKKRTILAHLIMNPVPKGLRVDHKDRNPLNNRRSNLRYATRSQNRSNALYRTNKSGFKGVSWQKGMSKWVANVQYEKVHYYLGNFNSKEDAARAYNAKASELQGEFAILNDV